MRRLFITRRIPGAEAILAPHFDVEARDLNEPLAAKELPRLVRDYDVVLSTLSERFTREVLGEGGRLRVLSNYAVGHDNIDLDHARKLGVAVYNTPDVVTASTADLTFALLLSLLRRVGDAREFVRQGRWTGWDPELFLGEELTGKTFGIIGFGRIGQAVARRALGFGLVPIYHSPREVDVDPELAGKVRRVALDELLAEADYISLHCPLTDETKDLVDGALIARMKKKPVLINMARGGVVSSDALLEALRSGAIRGAALDVTAPEPIGADSELLRLDNCLIVPHIGTATRDCRQAMGERAAENILRHFEIHGMKEDALVARLLPLLSEILDDSSIDGESSIAHTASWDSLKHTQILTAVEEHFDVVIGINDIIEMVSVPEMARVLAKYLPEAK